MNLKIIFFIIIYTISLFASDDFKEVLPNSFIEELRVTYYNGVEDEKYIDSLQLLVKSYYSKNQNNIPTIILAYSAGIDALKSKHAFWPFTKMSYLNSSMDLFKEVVNKDPNNLEIRFMRYSILHYVPGILGYSAELKEDQKVILSLLSRNEFQNVSDDLRNGIINFMIDSGRLTTAQISSLKLVQVSQIK